MNLLIKFTIIVLLAGDNLGDFFTDDTDMEARSTCNWPSSIGIDGKEESYRELIRKMTTPFLNNELFIKD